MLLIRKKSKKRIPSIIKIKNIKAYFEKSDLHNFVNRFFVYIKMKNCAHYTKKIIKYVYFVYRNEQKKIIIYLYTRILEDKNIKRQELAEVL